MDGATAVAMAMESATAMDSMRVTAIDGATAAQWHGRRSGDATTT